MGWRWRKSVNLGGGARTTVTARGLGVSWGLGGIRIGKSPTGSYWFSLTVPGTGISFIKYFTAGNPKSIDNQQSIQSTVPNVIGGPQSGIQNQSLTPNEIILDQMKHPKP